MWEGAEWVAGWRWPVRRVRDFRGVCCGKRGMFGLSQGVMFFTCLRIPNL